MDVDRGPDWVREAAATVWDEATRFVVTALQCTRHPRRFAAAWFAGETRAPNPIGYVSTALAITAAVRSATIALLSVADDTSFWANAGAATLPYVYYVLLGVLCHLVLRRRTGGRPLRASMAIALYIGGGPGLLLTLSMFLDLGLYAALTGEPPGSNGIMGAPGWAIPILLGVVFVGSALFLMAMASAFRGLHAASRGRALAAMVFAVAGSGLLLGALHAAFDFTLGVPHFVIGPHSVFDIFL